ncbi:uncharacterized protein MELLADRAFT_94974 [Melampsora larici-populina 98AG31]|uniref:Uncharacterized protein n=1 Tax=Melampsora larici-populina (strain 98AG31 / pathotype 3-4-7) TaxID=747676 RepID=F4S8N0_MELLP|nr:uncharacterized protein MELLADRAFT_94974 [Melampsora larici-populina 98AG31]EGF98997.1 hypothetical protein MELLADRAFT_94974 [Melampsora larici-populina 98AG31]
MANRKLSQVPSKPNDGRIDTGSRAIRTRSHQALLDQNRIPHEVTPATTPIIPADDKNGRSGFLGGSSAAPPYMQTPANNRYSTIPLSSQLLSPRYVPNPMINPIFSRSPSGVPPPYFSQPSSASSYNDHINPCMLFNHSRSLGSTPSSSSSSLVTSNPANPDLFGSPLKRPASQSEALERSGETDDDDHGSTVTSTTTPALNDPRAACPDEPRTFQVHFNIHQEQAPEADAPNTKRRRTPGGTCPSRAKPAKPKYQNYKPPLPHTLTLTPKNLMFSPFLATIFRSCNESLAGVSDALLRAWNERTL